MAALDAGAHTPDLPAHVLDLIRLGTAENTRKAYNADLRAFFRWGGALPTSPPELARYIAEEGQRLKPATIRRRLVSVGVAHGLLRAQERPHQHPLVRAALRGLLRIKGMRQRRVAPLLREDLLRILEVSGFRLGDLRDNALLLLGFAAGLRRSEIVGLEIRDLDLRPDSLIVTLRRSKTDQFGAGREIIVPQAKGHWCPVHETHRWIAAASLQDGPLFRPVSRQGVLGDRPLSGEAVAHIVKRRVSLIGLDPAIYSGHSLRAGFVTSAVQLGYGISAIRCQTGHSSDAMVSGYIRLPDHRGIERLQLL